MKTCAKCGAQNVDDAVFCSNCGNVFEQAAAPPVGATPAPPYSPQPPPGYPPQAPPPGAPYQQQAPYPMMAATSNSKATASLVLGIIGIFVCPIICSVLAIVFGYTARNEIAASGGRETGESTATAGIILGWVGIAITIIWVAIWIIVVAVASSSVLLPIFGV